MKKIVSVVLILALALSTTVTFAFSDVDAGHWAKEYIDVLSADGIINGYEDGSFRPEGNVTKAEFAKMLCVAFDTDSKNRSFDDIDEHWAKDYILKSADVLYAPSDAYLPDADATRAEIAYALANVVHLADGGAENDFADWNTVAEDMAARVSAAVANGIIEGYEDGTIRGSSSVTRAEAAALIVRALLFEPSVDETPEENPDVLPEEPEADTSAGEDAESTLDHMYTLYPMRDLIVIKSVTTVMNLSTGETDRKLTYCIAGAEDEEYVTVIPGDAETKVVGTKDSVAALAAGDVIVFDTAFHGYIDTILVAASFGGSSASVVIPESMKYGSGAEYEFAAGRVTKAEAKTKSYVITVENNDGTQQLTIPRSTDVTVYSSRGSGHWESDSLSSIEEGMFVLVRYTDSKATEVVVTE